MKSCFFFLALSGSAQAGILAGEITGGTSLRFEAQFHVLSAGPDLVVGNDTFDDLNLYAFDEDQNIQIDRVIEVDVGTSPQPGDVVASHYVFFDPAFGADQRGYVEFDAEIFGVATSTQTLKDSDFLAATEVRYLNPTLRGLEGGDFVWIDQSNPRRLRVDWAASTPGDYVRVFTHRSPFVQRPEVKTWRAAYQRKIENAPSDEVE